MFRIRDVHMQTSIASALPLQVPSFLDRDAVIFEHLPQIKCVAVKICSKLPASVDANDLIGDGVLGLLDAVEKFDPARGVSFKTYAQYRIRGAILDSLRNQDWTSRSMRRKSRRLESTRQSTERLLGRAPTQEELARAMNLQLGKLHELMNKINGMKMSSLSDPFFEESGLHDPVAGIEDSSSPENPFTYLLQSEIRSLFVAAIDDLPDRERTIISLYYYDDFTMAEIAKILHLNPSRISQIHTRAMTILRSKLVALAERK
jgi:RNA polymerase sigma factor for flagellar operon FliA